jgi:outer membrane protein TolC
LLLAGLLATPATAGAQQLDEQAVVRLAHAHGPALRLQRARLHAAEVEEQASGLYPDPALHWEREHVPGHGAADELALTWPLDVAGGRGARGAGARR